MSWPALLPQPDPPDPACRSSSPPTTARSAALRRSSNQSRGGNLPGRRFRFSAPQAAREGPGCAA